jgi:hypothetical protein
MFRTMQFSNFNQRQGINQNYAANLARTIAGAPVSRPMTLSAPMVSRVHAVKPGCSACGKKVA